MQTPEPTSLTIAQQQRAEALRIVRQLFTLPSGFLGREKLPMEAANPVIALAEWILEERPVRAEAVTPGNQETPYEQGKEVWTVGHGREPRQWFVDQRGAWVEADVEANEDLPEAEAPDNAVQADVSDPDVTEEDDRG